MRRARSSDGRTPKRLSTRHLSLSLIHISHMLIGARELVEKRRLSAVLVACQRKNHTGTSSTVMLLASSLRSVRL